jgi:aminocarboxymuconate-semialdehyde decarboxylase
MLFGGIFEKFPDLRVCFSHAGGSFPATIGRIEHGFNCRPDLVAIDTQKNPREYLGHFWVDSITHDARTLEFVLDVIGKDKVCLGSDYPFPLGDLEIGAFIEEMNLDQSVKENIFYKATLDWLNLDVKRFID